MANALLPPPFINGTNPIQTPKPSDAIPLNIFTVAVLDNKHLPETKSLY